MHRIEVFDPAFCCPSGVCGPRVDPTLLRVSSDLKWLSLRGVNVTRYNLAHQPQAFMANELVRAALAAEPETCLPLILLDGRIACKGTYPDRAQWAAWTGIDVTAEAAK